MYIYGINKKTFEREYQDQRPQRILMRTRALTSEQVPSLRRMRNGAEFYEAKGEPVFLWLYDGAEGGVIARGIVDKPCVAGEQGVSPLAVSTQCVWVNSLNWGRDGSPLTKDLLAQAGIECQLPSLGHSIVPIGASVYNAILRLW